MTYSYDEPDESRPKITTLGIIIIIILIGIVSVVTWNYVTSSQQNSLLQHELSTDGPSTVTQLTYYTVTNTVNSTVSRFYNTTTVYSNTTTFHVTVVNYSTIARNITTTKFNTTTATVTTEVTPTQYIWTTSVNMNGGYYVETIPDTFDYYDYWITNATMSVYYMTVFQFTHWTNQNQPPTNYTSVVGASTQGTDVFRLGEGCGGYIAVYYPSNLAITTLFTPQIYVTYNPSSTPTGICQKS